MNRRQVSISSYDNAVALARQPPTKRNHHDSPSAESLRSMHPHIGAHAIAATFSLSKSAWCQSIVCANATLATPKPIPTIRGQSIQGLGSHSFGGLITSNDQDLVMQLVTRCNVSSWIADRGSRTYIDRSKSAHHSKVLMHISYAQQDS